MDLSHLVRISLCEVIIDRDNVDSLSCEGVQIGRQSAHERFTLARRHLCDLSLVQRHSAHQLYVIVPQAEAAEGCLTHHGERFLQRRVHCFLSAPDCLHERRATSLQLLVSQSLDLLLQSIDLRDSLPVPRQHLFCLLVRLLDHRLFLLFRLCGGVHSLLQPVEHPHVHHTGPTTRSPAPMFCRPGDSRATYGRGCSQTHADESHFRASSPLALLATPHSR
mmetsp:Transcript_2782/g.8443  ORF Transcript_2782/g.8443 Transcript_2782/m.8443 type:complete len:221 (-) Transcript_2782:351-1013(-)